MIADAQRDDSERNGQEISADTPTYAGQLGAFGQEQAGFLVEVHPLRHGVRRVLAVAVAGRAPGAPGKAGFGGAWWSPWPAGGGPYPWSGGGGSYPWPGGGG